jgi:indole-3-glycerol phosphate synthase
MFAYFKQAKSLEIKALQRLCRRDALPPPWPGRRPGFVQALRAQAERRGLALIAEYKRASPSQGDIDLGLSARETARAYAQAGAAAISVLTEKSRFKGRLGFMTQAWQGVGESGPPLLRKDFIFHSLQVRATASVPAAALLLIVKLTPCPRLLRDLREEAESYGLQCVVEVFDEDDLACARRSGAKIIQVNARDFSAMTVDLERCLAFGRRLGAEAGEFRIAASGFSRPEQLIGAREAGYGAVLAGAALMRGGDPAGALARLTSALGK